MIFQLPFHSSNCVIYKLDFRFKFSAWVPVFSVMISLLFSASLHWHCYFDENGPLLVGFHCCKCFFFCTLEFLKWFLWNCPFNSLREYCQYPPNIPLTWHSCQKVWMLHQQCHCLISVFANGWRLLLLRKEHRTTVIKRQILFHCKK